MDISGFVRDAPRIHANLREMPDESLVTIKGCKIYIPARFTERNLASVGIETHIVAIFAIVVEDKYYASNIANAMIKIEPTTTNKVSINGDEYLEFVFEPGSTVTKSLQLVKVNTLVYRIYDEFFAKGRVPWYLGYKELAKIFDTSKHHAGANIGSSHEVTELLVSMVARSRDDKTVYYRQVAKSEDDLVTNPPVIVPLKSVVYSATNTLNKLAGSYMQDGIVSALVSPSDRQERIEGILRA